MFILFFSPYRPQVRGEHQNRAGRRVIAVDPDIQIDQSDNQGHRNLQIQLHRKHYPKYK